MSETARLTDAQLEALETELAHYHHFKGLAGLESHFHVNNAVRSVMDALPALLSELRTLRAQMDARPSMSDWSGFDTALDTLQSRAEDTSARLDAAFWSGSEE